MNVYAMAMPGAPHEHGMVMASSSKIAEEAWAMISASAVFIVSGILCLFLSGFVMYKLMPREGRPASSWTKTEFGETGVALGQFILLVAGLALVAKGILS